MVDEIKNSEAKEQTESNGDKSSGIQSATNDPISRALEARKGLEAENERLEKNIAELQRIRSMEILGGGSLGGSTAVTPKDAQMQRAKQMADEISGAFR